MLQLANAAASGPVIFDESLMFKDTAAAELKEDFRNRFRNVSRLMDCVGCDKCRLWGKVQTQGYGTALKVLFEFDEALGVDGNPPLRRTELVALVNTLDKLSTSLNAVGKFQQMWEMRERDVGVGAESETESKKENENEKETDNNKQTPTHTQTPQAVVEAEPEDEEPEKDLSVGQLFKMEIEIVWEAMKLVVWSWYKFPEWWLVFFFSFLPSSLQKLFG